MESMNTRRKARERLDERLASIKSVEIFQRPPNGWIKAIREAIGMSGVQFARRLGVTAQTVSALEKSEKNAAIKLETLQKAAEALDCTLVYALVPNSTLNDAVKRQAIKKAREALLSVSHTMKLEDQSVKNTGVERQIDDYIQDTLKDRDLWSAR